MRTSTKVIGIGVASILAIGAYSLSARSAETGMPFMQGMMGHGMMAQGMTGQGAMGAGGINMHAPGTPGHEGVTATADEMDGIHQLFADYNRITRAVTDLPNGIRTVTESDDPAVAKIIKDHVAGMTQRIAEGRDPGLPIESPELRALFQNKDKIVTSIDVTEKGVAVTQTSDDAKTVALLQTHAGQVTDFVKEGMTALHAAMMKTGAMPAGMPQGDMMQNMMTMMQGGPGPDRR